MAASQTADVQDRAGRGHETYDDADGDDAADGGGADGTGTTPVPVPLRAQTMLFVLGNADVAHPVRSVHYNPLSGGVGDPIAGATTFSC